MLRTGSFFTGVGGFELGFNEIAEPAFFSEIDPAACAVLSHRFPHIPNLGDIKEINAHAVKGFDVDCVVAGWPCQDLSIAGSRQGLAGARSSLFFELMRLVGAARPRWLVFENVPGLLSSQQGHDFAAVLAALADLGYGLAWRVLDAQWFGLPQRRRRVFVVGHLGAPARAAQVLLEPEGGRWDPPPRRPTRPQTAAAAGSRTDRHHRSCRPLPAEVASTLQARGRTPDAEGAAGGHLVPVAVQTPAVDPASALLASAGHHGYSSPRGDGCDPLVVQAFALRGRPGGAAAERHGNGETTGAVRAASGGSSRDYLVTGVGAAVSENQQAVCRLSQVCNSLTAGGGKPGQGYPAALVGPLILADGIVVCGCGLRVRRLTPRECERLMGLPDDWTLVPLKTCKNGRIRMTADSGRYRLCGNAVAVPVVTWIARRLARADAMKTNPRPHLRRGSSGSGRAS